MYWNRQTQTKCICTQTDGFSSGNNQVYLPQCICIIQLGNEREGALKSWWHWTIVIIHHTMLFDYQILSSILLQIACPYGNKLPEKSKLAMWNNRRVMYAVICWIHSCRLLPRTPTNLRRRRYLLLDVELCTFSLNHSTVSSAPKIRNVHSHRLSPPHLTTIHSFAVRPPLAYSVSLTQSLQCGWDVGQ